MRIMILGGDGYLGWPTAMAFCNAGHEVRALDNYFRRRIAAETNSDALTANPRLPDRAAIFRADDRQAIEIAEGDCCDFDFSRRRSSAVSRQTPSSITPSSPRRPIR